MEIPKLYTLNDFKHLLPESSMIYGRQDVEFDNVNTIQNVNDRSLDWINPSNPHRQSNFELSPASCIICDPSINIELHKQLKLIIVVPDPKLTFSIIVTELFGTKRKTGIHPTAFIEKKAQIGSNCYIGPFCYVGECIVGDNVSLMGHVHIYDGCSIGDRVIIHAGTVVGADGFGYVRDETGNLTKFPHLATVVIESDVEIGSNTCIDKGALSNTVIKRGAKIDNLVHIAHNVVVGENSCVIAHAMVAGSVVIGDNSWVAPCASIREQLQIGNNVTVGVGAVVTKNIPDNSVWTGSPAKPLDEFIKMQKKISSL